MKEMAIYMLEVLVCSGVLLSVYAILLDRQVRFRWCRIYLLAAMVAAVVIPALQIPVWPGEVITAAPVMYAEPFEWVAAPVAEPSITPEEVCTAIYLLGAGLILGLMIWQTIRIYRLRRNARITRTDRFSLVRTPQKIASFSFFRSIFIWHKTPEEDFPAIIAHESSHIAHRHSVERIAMECLKAVMWWNPFVWIASRRLTEVEEYEADSDVLQSGYDIQNYMQILLKQLFGHTPEIANGLRDSLTKKRFKMMTDNTPNKRNLLRLAGTLPAVIALVCLFGFTTHAAVIQTPEATSTTGSETVASTETILQPEELPLPTAENPKTCKVQIIVSEVISREGVVKDEPIQGATIEVVNMNTAAFTDKEGRATLIAPRGNTLKVAYLGFKPVYIVVNDAQEMISKVRLTQEGNIVTQELELRTGSGKNNDKEPLWIVDGVERININSLQPNEIAQISVLKDQSATAKYGPRAANGVILITTKQAAAQMSESERSELKLTKITGIPDSEDAPFITTEVMPSFQGGDLNTFRQWVQSQVKFPAELLKSNIQGRVTLSFVIERDGSVRNIQILQTPDHVLSEEAKRVIASSPKWTPGMQRGQAVRVRYTLPVDFKIMNDTPEKLEPYVGENEEMPKFRNGGLSEFRKWVQENVKYPAEALNNNVAGRVVVTFNIGKDGSVKPGKVLQTPDKTLSEEVMRVLKKSPDWTPGTQKGKAVSVKYTLPIDFNISTSDGIERGPQKKKIEGDVPEIKVVGFGTRKR